MLQREYSFRHMLEVTDYCGIVSGKKADKSDIFRSFYGKLGKAPMIHECPVNLECRLVDTLDFGGGSEVFIGEILESYAEEKYFCNGIPDVEKIEPIVFSMYDNNYWGIGEHLGKAWYSGKFSQNINEDRSENKCRKKAFEEGFCRRKKGFDSNLKISGRIIGLPISISMGQQGYLIKITVFNGSHKGREGNTLIMVEEFRKEQKKPGRLKILFWQRKISGAAGGNLRLG